MSQKIDMLVEEIFKQSLYSKSITEAKSNISKAFENKYNELCENNTEIEALGMLMSQYGTVENAGKMAGYTDEEIKNWNCFDNVTSCSKFAKMFRTSRKHLYLISIITAILVSKLIDLFVYRSVINVSIFISLTLWFLYGRFLWKKRQKGSFSFLCFDLLGKQYIEKHSDRYTKRLINSIYLVVGGIAYIIFLFVNSVWNGGLTYAEALTSILTGLTAIQVVAYILFKNILCRYWISFDLEDKTNLIVKKYALRTILISGVYWIVVSTLLFVLRNSVSYPFNWFVVAAVCYFILAMVCNLTLRKNIVFQNLTINIKRSLIVGLCVILTLSYQIMKMDFFLLQPYISRVESVYNQPDIIKYNDKTGTYTITSDKEDFKILQLTDIHLGGSPVSLVKDYKALQACSVLIDKTKPDLVIVTGDLVFPVGIASLSFNNTAPIIEFSNFMRNKGVPWAFLYGNHDTEVYASGSVEEVQNTFKSLSFKTSGKLLYPYVQPNITGRNNQIIELRNSEGTLNQALFLMDSNDYIAGFQDYDYIHDDEVDWYKTQVERLNKNEGKTISSLLFFHMPLQQYKTVYELYTENSDKVKYFFGENKEKMFDKVCCSKYPSKIFDVAKQLGSTKAMFCGHDHYNNLSVEYEGIRLTYGMSIDYLAMPGIDKDTDQRGGTVITCHKDSTYDIQQIKLD